MRYKCVCCIIIQLPPREPISRLSETQAFPVITIHEPLVNIQILGDSFYTLLNPEIFT